MKRASLCGLLLLAMNNASATAYNFDYTVNGAEAVGITRAFDNGQNTVLAFLNPITVDRPTVTTDDGSVLNATVVGGNYLVLPGLQRHVLIYTKGVVAQVQYGRAPLPPVAAQIQPPAAAVAAPQVTAPSAAPAAPASAPAAAAATPGQASRVIVTSSVGGVQTAPAVATSAGGGSAAPASAASPAASSPAAGGLAVVTDELPPEQAWFAKASSTLRVTTEAWARQAGWSVRWMLADGDDYEVEGRKYSGDFTDALAQLYAPYFAPSFNDSKPLKVRAYAKQKIIVVTE